MLSKVKGIRNLVNLRPIAFRTFKGRNFSILIIQKISMNSRQRTPHKTRSWQNILTNPWKNSLKGSSKDKLISKYQFSLIISRGSNLSKSESIKYLRLNNNCSTKRVVHMSRKKRSLKNNKMIRKLH